MLCTSDCPEIPKTRLAAETQCEGAHGRLSVGVYDIHRVQKLQA